VRSFDDPLGERVEHWGARDAARRQRVRAATKSMYLAHGSDYAGRVARLDLVCSFDPFSSESIRFLNFLEQDLQTLADDPQSEWHGTAFYFLGITAGIRDLKEVTGSDLLLIQCLVPAAVLLVLISIIRRPLISVYLVLSVLFGYYVSMGVTKLLFMGLYGDTFDGLDWKVPMFLFVILVAIGEDYNIYLVTRVVEEQKRLGPVEGLRVALVRTGGIITSCGIIMAGTFASMMTGTLRAIIELGWALSFGVLLDTFVIRTVLVPVFLVLWDRLWRKTGSG
jgi:RND superfamily putative drug exporter